MNLRNQMITATAFLLLSGGSAIASDDYDVAFAKEVDACLAAVNEQVDYDDATRVRHNVVELQNTFSGYVLAIDTQVFTDTDEIAVREYASKCIAKDDGKPRKFSINKVKG